MESHSMSPGTVSTAINKSNYQYDVFLSHRGCDTKNNFVGHLYKGLRSRGIRVFLDKEELQEGEDLTYQIEAVIKNAAIHLAIFSENYASSAWCLNELVLMVDSGAIIIPVFFKNVEPTHLRRIKTPNRETEQNGSHSRETELTGSQTQETGQTGSQAWGTGQIESQTRETEQTRRQTQETEQTRRQMQETEKTGNRADQMSKFAEGFRSLQNKMDNRKWPYDHETIRKWTEALSIVSNISGLELKAYNGYEAELLEKIVQCVSEKLHKSLFYVPKYEVGLDEKIEDFREKVLSQQQQNEKPRVVGKKVLSQQQQNEKPRVVGIVGFGGVGKTTLAKKFFQIESPAYRNSCFLSVSGNGCRTPLHTLFRELMPHLDPSPHSVSVVKNFLMSDPSVAMIQNNPSLVILDGVDNVQMREELLEIQVLLHSRSLILITSRDPEVLRCSEVEDKDIYKLDVLNTPCSQKLFCFHAFHEAAPLQGYEYLVAWFLGVCNGSPLLLKLLGSLLSGNKDRFSWEDLLDRFQERSSDKIQEKLEVIYDKLGKEEQQTFLEIARENVGRDADDALNFWKRSGRKVTWFQILLEKRLVEVDSKGRIHMHNLLKEFGEKIAKETKLPLRLFPSRGR